MDAHRITHPVAIGAAAVALTLATVLRLALLALTRGGR